ncbi:MAG: YeeE/YedE family protein [Firmicutes bacterium]|nr:YeeE/YedE family protein [Bacillota bacterium]
MMLKLVAGGLTGVLFGFMAQRGRFCMTSAFRDLYLTRDATLFKAYILVLAIQSAAIFALHGAGVITFGNDPFRWLGAVAGGLIFGLSMVLAGGCAAGTLFRVGEGLVGALITAVFFAIGALASRGQGLLALLVQRIQGPSITVNGATSLYGALGISPWLLVAALWAVALAFLWRSRREPAQAWQLPTEEGRSSLWRAVFGQGWSWPVTGVAVGLICVVGWLTSISTGRMGGLSIAGGTANLLRFFTVTGDGALLNWGEWLVLGIPVGGFIASWAAGEFRLRSPGAARLLQHMVGGLGMGFGATLARGCNIGNGLVAVSQFSLNGWTATLFTIFGVWLGSYLFLVLPSRRAATAVGVVQEAPSS